MSSGSLISSVFDKPATRAMLERKGARHPVVRRFVAGDQLSDALQVMKLLRDAGLFATAVYLSSPGTESGASDAAVNQYLEAIRAVATFYPDAHVLVKLSSIGLLSGEAVARDNLRRILVRGQERDGIFIRVDAELAEHVGATFAIAQDLHQTFPNLGVTVQSKLRRSDKDITELTAAGIPIRLTRGETMESTVTALTDPAAIDKQYRLQMFKLLDLASEGKAINPIIATDDEKLLADCRLYAKKQNLTGASFEIAMTLGVNPELQERMNGAGLRVRVDVPYGEQWYPYFALRASRSKGGAAMLLNAMLKG